MSNIKRWLRSSLCVVGGVGTVVKGFNALFSSDYDPRDFTTNNKDAIYYKGISINDELDEQTIQDYIASETKYKDSDMCMLIQIHHKHNTHFKECFNTFYGLPFNYLWYRRKMVSSMPYALADPLSTAIGIMSMSGISWAGMFIAGQLLKAHSAKVLKTRYKRLFKK